MHQSVLSLQTLPLEIPAAGTFLDGDLIFPEHPSGMILFAPGGGSSRLSPRSRQAAGVLNRAGFATLLVDLLSPDEEEIDHASGTYRFDIELVADRLVAAARFIDGMRKAPHYKIGFYGIGTGAAASLVAAARIPELVSAVVSRGGRPDLAGGDLLLVKAPTLLIVGEKDRSGLELNLSALECLTCDKKLEIVIGASHQFKESQALERAAKMASDWFDLHLGVIH